MPHDNVSDRRGFLRRTGMAVGAATAVPLLGAGPASASPLTAAKPRPVVHPLTRFDVDSTLRFGREFEEAFYRGDHRALASVYAEGARLIAQGTAPVVGRPAIAEFWKSACARARKLGMRRTILHDEQDTSGDLAYMRSRTILKIPAKKGKPITITARAVTTWRREADGVWRMTVDLSNTDVSLESGELPYGTSLKH
ncbi:YybH family protein [Spongiactinospora rosea]|nr:DUF4440 domain-containing protein [Spongiactinospora rosea]